MHLINIAGINVKGRNFSEPTSPMTIIVGDNAKGKTAIADAVRIAALGYLPSLGKKAGATMGIAPTTAKQMEVQASYDDGSRIRRTFTRTRTGASLESFGWEPRIHPAQLDFSEFLNAKPTDRNSILKTIIGEIDPTALADKMVTKMAELGIGDDFALTIDPNSERPLDATITAAGEHGKALKQSISQWRKTLASLSETHGSAPATAEAAAVTEAEREVAMANEAVGTTAANSDKLAEILQRMPEEPENPKPTDADHKDAQEKRYAAEMALREGEKNHQEATLRKQRIAALERHRLRLNQVIQQSDGKPQTVSEPEASKALAEAQEALEAARVELAGFQREITSEQRMIDMHRKNLETLAAGTCPCCGATGDQLVEAQQKIQDQIEAIEATIEMFKNETEKANRNIEAEQKAIREWTAEIAAIKAAEAHTELETVEAELAKLIEQDAELDLPALQRAADQAAAETQRLAELASEWSDYEAFAKSKPTPEQIEQAAAAFREATARRRAAEERLAELQAAKGAHAAWVAQKAQIEKLDKEATEAEGMLGKIEELKGFLKNLQTEAVEAAIAPLRQTTGIFLECLVAGDFATKDHVIGIQRGDEFLPAEVLSGMEAVALAAAFQAALATQSDLPILIVDEMARMTPERAAIFAKNCRRAIESGIISQAFLIDQKATPYSDPDCALITVG